MLLQVLGVASFLITIGWIVAGPQLRHDVAVVLGYLVVPIGSVCVWGYFLRDYCDRVDRKKRDSATRKRLASSASSPNDGGRSR